MTKGLNIPGPWRIENCSSGGWRRYIKGPTTNSMYNVAVTDDANAPLIAAAPDLLEVLVELDDSWTSFFPGGPDSQSANPQIINLAQEHRAIWRKVRAAITKARGEAA